MRIFSPILKKKERKEQKFTESVYIENPRITAIVQFFNKRSYLENLIIRLHNLPIDEIIFIDDGSEDGSIFKMVDLLIRKNDFILRSNDLFEIRTYDRALGMARGEFVVLLQDDDLPPTDTKWIQDAIMLFQNDPNLLILGGREGLNLKIPDPINPKMIATYTIKNHIASWPGINKYELIRPPRFRMRNTPFEYVMAINRAPMWIRRKPFVNGVGIDQIFAPFQCDDVDSCIRAWMAEYHVGLYSANFKHVAKSGMQTYNKNRIADQAEKNWKLIYTRYTEFIRDNSIQRLVDNANNCLINLKI